MRVLQAAIALILMAPLPAFAQTTAPSTADVYLGLGVGNFDQDLGRHTEPGIAWNVHATLNPTPNLGVEFDYQGLRSTVRSVMLPNGTNGEGSVTLQDAFSLNAKGTLPFHAGPGSIEPYLFGGIGYAWLSSSALFGSVGSSSDNTAVVPLGGGVSYVFKGGFAFDLRATYNFLTGERSSFVPSGNSWTVMLALGYRVINRGQ